MTERELTDEELLYAPEEDWAFYNKCIEGLPLISDKDGIRIGKDGQPVPYGSGPHILKWFKEAIEISSPKAILEIGFNLGYGSAMLLNLSDAYVLSLDNRMTGDILDATNHLKGIYKDRFDFGWTKLFSTRLKIEDAQFDLCFVDGGHEEEDVTADIQLCLNYKIPYLLFDDIYPRFGPGVLPSIAKFPELELVKYMNNLRLYKVNYDV